MLSVSRRRRSDRARGQVARPDAPAVVQLFYLSSCKRERPLRKQTEPKGKSIARTVHGRHTVGVHPFWHSSNLSQNPTSSSSWVMTSAGCRWGSTMKGGWDEVKLGHKPQG
jgi:hypothetical protein